MTDLVERLREITPDVCGKSYWWAKNVKEAADEIAALRAEVAANEWCAFRLAEAVELLRKTAFHVDPDVNWKYAEKVDAFLAAYAAKASPGCQHDLLEPGSTVDVHEDGYGGTCRVCGQTTRTKARDAKASP